MSISDIIFEARHQARLRTFGQRVVSDEEPLFCEDCGASLDFCECNTALNYEEEEIDD